jgi:hypothetical protein
VLEPAGTLEFTFAFGDPSIRGLFAVKCLSFALEDHAGFFDNNWVTKAL